MYEISITYVKKNIYYLSRSCCALSYFYKICHVATSNHVVSKSHACDSDFIACLHSRNSYYPNSKSALVDVVNYSICFSLKKKKKKKKEERMFTIDTQLTRTISQFPIHMIHELCQLKSCAFHYLSG